MASIYNTPNMINRNFFSHKKNRMIVSDRFIPRRDTGDGRETRFACNPSGQPPRKCVGVSDILMRDCLTQSRGKLLSFTGNSAKHDPGQDDSSNTQLPLIRCKCSDDTASKFGCESTKCPLRKTWMAPEQPKKILDAPGLDNDFYKQGLDWGLAGIVAAVAGKIFLCGWRKKGVKKVFCVQDEETRQLTERRTQKEGMLGKRAETQQEKTQNSNFGTLPDFPAEGSGPVQFNMKTPLKRCQLEEEPETRSTPNDLEDSRVLYFSFEESEELESPVDSINSPALETPDRSHFFKRQNILPTPDRECLMNERKSGHFFKFNKHDSSTSHKMVQLENQLSQSKNPDLSHLSKHSGQNESSASRLQGIGSLNFDSVFEMEPQIPDIRKIQKRLFFDEDQGYGSQNFVSNKKIIFKSPKKCLNEGLKLLKFSSIPEFQFDSDQNSESPSSLESLNEENDQDQSQQDNATIFSETEAQMVFFDSPIKAHEDLSGVKSKIPTFEQLFDEDDQDDSDTGLNLGNVLGPLRIGDPQTPPVQNAIFTPKHQKCPEIKLEKDFAESYQSIRENEICSSEMKQLPNLALHPMLGPLPDVEIASLPDSFELDFEIENLNHFHESENIYPRDAKIPVLPDFQCSFVSENPKQNLLLVIQQPSENEEHLQDTFEINQAKPKREFPCHHDNQEPQKSNNNLTRNPNPLTSLETLNLDANPSQNETTLLPTNEPNSEIVEPQSPQRECLGTQSNELTEEGSGMNSNSISNNELRLPSLTDLRNQLLPQTPGDSTPGSHRNLSQLSHLLNDLEFNDSLICSSSQRSKRSLASLLPPPRVLAIKLNSNSGLLAVSASNKKIYVLDLQKNTLLCQKRMLVCVTTLDFWRENILATGDQLGNVKIFDIDTGMQDELIDIQVHRNKPVCKLLFSEDGIYLASSGLDNKVFFLQLHEISHLLYKEEMSPNLCARSRPFRRKVAQHLRFESAHKRLQTPVILKTLIAKFSSTPKALAWHPIRRRTLFIGGGVDDRQIRAFDLPSRKLLIQADTGSQISALRFGRDGDRLISAHGFPNNDLKIWDLDIQTRKLNLRQVLNGHQERVLHMALSPCGNMVVSASADETLRIWEVTRPKQEKRLLYRDFRKFGFSCMR